MASSVRNRSLGEAVVATPVVGSGAENPRMLLRALPWQDRLVLLSGLGLVTLLAWIYLVDMATGMKAMSMGTAWTTAYWASMLLMWIIMMVGMMVPSAIPMILIHAAVARKAAREGATLASTGFFIAGYVLIWSLFSVAATATQWALDRAALLSPMLTSNSARLGGILFCAAGLYQLTPMKAACLRHCRAPVHFLSRHWRPGVAGALWMGFEHGLYCLGCCWILMSLLFVGGVMSIWWIGSLTLFVLAEKVLPRGGPGGRILGLAATAWGVALLISG